MANSFSERSEQEKIRGRSNRISGGDRSLIFPSSLVRVRGDRRPLRQSGCALFCPGQYGFCPIPLCPEPRRIWVHFPEPVFFPSPSSRFSSPTLVDFNRKRSEPLALTSMAPAKLARESRRERSSKGEETGRREAPFRLLPAERGNTADVDARRMRAASRTVHASQCFMSKGVTTASAGLTAAKRTVRAQALWVCATLGEECDTP